ncbi:MAG: serine/threonine protein kinase [Nannocystaceae bacterium]|nr:serine/threonine protein kinase [Nannocystaceae bacterium]
MSSDTPHLVADEETQTAELATGTTLSFSKQYQVMGRLGEGGMGKVFKAFDPIMNRYVALKVLKVDVPESEQRRFRLEARLCGSFSHPNLVRVHDVGTTSEHGLFWFVMDFLEGKDLSVATASGRPIPLHVVCEIFREVLHGLNYVHKRGIVHRDIKPANLFVSRDPSDPSFRPVKILDFGVARDLADTRPEHPKLILGDPRYLPPEQSRPNGPIDGRSDLYALGMSFFEVVTAHHPFEDVFGQHPRELLKCQRSRVPLLPSTYLPVDTPLAQAEAIDAFFVRATAKDPNERFESARAMQVGLAALARLAH